MVKYAFFASSIQLKSEFISFDLFSLDTKRVSFFSISLFDINRVVQRERRFEQIIRIKNLDFIQNRKKLWKRALIEIPLYHDISNEFG